MNKDDQKNTYDGDDDVQIKIARISLRQTVIVSVISAVSAFLVALVGGYFAFASNGNNPSALPQRYITIRSIEGASYPFRLNIEVNNVTFVYPVNSLWADPLSPSLPVTFPISYDEEYSVYFFGWENVESNPVAFNPQPSDLVRFSGASETRTSSMMIPFAVQFEIHE